MEEGKVSEYFPRGLVEPELWLSRCYMSFLAMSGATIEKGPSFAGEAITGSLNTSDGRV